MVRHNFILMEKMEKVGVQFIKKCDEYVQKEYKKIEEQTKEREEMIKSWEEE